MLILSRKKGHAIMIKDDIKIVVVDIRGDKVRLGVDAPKDVPAHRLEVYEAIQRGERSSAKPKGPDAHEAAAKEEDRLVRVMLAIENAVREETNMPPVSSMSEICGGVSMKAAKAAIAEMAAA